MENSSTELVALNASPKSDPYVNRNSLESRFRANRFKIIEGIIQSILDAKGSCRILDLGGTERYWNIGAEFIGKNAASLHITLVNTDPIKVENTGLFTAIEGSATDETLLQDDSFDFVHSNSVIEHVGEFGDMVRFAENVRRLAPRYYVQTPNYWFPYEPHFRCVGFQYLPEWVRIEALRRFNIGFFARHPNRDDAAWLVHHHRLLSARQMSQLFPGAEIKYEKIGILNKSIIAVQ